jgi:hypothetical protein
MRWPHSARWTSTSVATIAWSRMKHSRTCWMPCFASQGGVVAGISYVLILRGTKRFSSVMRVRCILYLPKYWFSPRAGSQSSTLISNPLVFSTVCPQRGDVCGLMTAPPPHARYAMGNTGAPMWSGSGLASMGWDSKCCHGDEERCHLHRVALYRANCFQS